jgi:voltage-gated sodium channel
MVGRCIRLSESAGFNRLVLVLILVSCAILGALTNPEVEERWGSLLYAADHVILWFFVMELAIRAIASAPRIGDYFKNGWNVFDAAVIVLSALPIHSEAAAVFRLVRVLRALRLIRAVPKLQNIVSAMLKSISSLGYIGLILMLLFYIYAIIGIKLFRDVDPLHFGSLGGAFLALFQVLTLEGWTAIMRTLMAAGPLYEWLTPLYFVSFILFGTMVILNLIIGIIVSGMMENQIEARSQDVAEGSMEQKLAEIEDTADELKAEISRVRKQFAERKR